LDVGINEDLGLRATDASRRWHWGGGGREIVIAVVVVDGRRVSTAPTAIE